RRHILVCNVSLSFDAGAGQLYVSSNPNGIKLRVETDMLDPADQPQLKEIEAIEQEIKDINNEVWDEAFLRHMPQAFVNALSDHRGQFEFSLGRTPTDGDVPRIDLSPALILRKRSQRGYIRLLKEIESHIDSTLEVPGGIREMIDPVAAEAARKERVAAEDRSQAAIDDALKLNSGDGPTRAIRDNEIFFPLPANKEQYEIAHRLNYGRGVLVQGPPGTGKTHTITNLICHLLANGSRVLITSETPRGLQSLRSKFDGAARPIADLCVMLLGNDAGSIEALERSVQAINSKLPSFARKAARYNEMGLAADLLKVRTEKRKSEQDLKAIRERDIYKHTNVFNLYSGTVQRISQEIRSQKPEYMWLVDDLDESFDAQNILTMNPESFVRSWFSLSQKPDIDRSLGVIELAKLPTSDEFATTIRQVQSQEAIVAKLLESADETIAVAAKACDRQLIQSLRNSLHSILAGMRQLKEHALPWVFQAGKEVVNEQDGRWRELLHVSHLEITRCSDHVREASSAQVKGADDADIRRMLHSTEVLRTYVADGNKLKRGIFQPREIKDAFKSLKEVFYNGQLVQDEKTLNQFSNWLIAKDALANLKQHWDDLAPSTGGTINLQLAEYSNLIEPLELAVRLHDHVTEAQQSIDLIGIVGAPAWHSIDHLQAYINALDLQGEKDRLASMKHDYEDLRSTSIAAFKTQPKHIAALDNIFSDRDAFEYASLLEQTTLDNQTAATRNQLFDNARSVRRNLPKTFESFSKSTGIEDWISRFQKLETAISWRRAQAWVTRQCDSNSAEILNEKVAAFDKEERRILGELAAERAWRFCLARLTETQRQSLVAWLQAIAKIGKGGGKYAERHRATAREELRRCQSAIPAWVMPMHRVVDNVGAEPEQFDVAIIDEASQSGPEAMILNYIAKKVVVVGDDKQIRPLNVGINHEDAEQFRSRYLSDIAHSQSFDLNSSYFSQAELRFPNYIRLKEHFRCMPEIILFSNNNFYATDPLVSLRQFGGGRLLPVVSAEYVEGGFRSGKWSKITNELEARRVVELIATCCEDPAYEGKSIGVICLAGGQQDQLIQKL
ncbi:AAA family ATPase, partial [Mariniblastus sp.]|nr:AAA family ATPase [Mariniblastus sp.]